MELDIVKGLGHLALGTRLKRLGERLQAQTQVVLETAGIDLPASYFPLLVALDRMGSMNVGELTQAMGISQPGVTRLVDKLIAADLVRSTQSTDDRRVRSIALSKEGRQLIARAKRVALPAVEAAVADACSNSGQPLLPLLAALEDALAVAPLPVRAERLRGGGTHERS
jgi:DNA-binding MarR family transcriptional regulator